MILKMFACWWYFFDLTFSGIYLLKIWSLIGLIKVTNLTTDLLISRITRICSGNSMCRRCWCFHQQLFCCHTILRLLVKIPTTANPEIIPHVRNLLNLRSSLPFLLIVAQYLNAKGAEVRREIAKGIRILLCESLRYLAQFAFKYWTTHKRINISIKTFNSNLPLYTLYILPHFSNQ